MQQHTSHSKNPTTLSAFLLWLRYSTLDLSPKAVCSPPGVNYTTPPLPARSLGGTWKCINLDSSLQSKGSFEETPVVSPRGEVTGARYWEKGLLCAHTGMSDTSMGKKIIYSIPPIYSHYHYLAEHLEPHSMTCQVIVFYMCCDLFVSWRSMKVTVTWAELREGWRLRYVYICGFTFGHFSLSWICTEVNAALCSDKETAIVDAVQPFSLATFVFKNCMYEYDSISMQRCSMICNFSLLLLSPSPLQLAVTACKMEEWKWQRQSGNSYKNSTDCRQQWKMWYKVAWIYR